MKVLFVELLCLLLCSFYSFSGTTYPADKCRFLTVALTSYVNDRLFVMHNLLRAIIAEKRSFFSVRSVTKCKIDESII